VVGTASGHVRPGPTAPIGDQVGALWTRTDQLGVEIRDARAEANHRADAISACLETTTTRLDELGTEIRDRLDKQQVANTTLNARGLPVIAVVSR
jgi:hypothetical protein